jgi:uncharacterized protein with NRDE domain
MTAQQDLSNILAVKILDTVRTVIPETQGYVFLVFKETEKEWSIERICVGRLSLQSCMVMQNALVDFIRDQWRGHLP